MTWTGDGTLNKTIPHGLKCQPGLILLKSVNAVDDWVACIRTNENAWSRGDENTSFSLNSNNGATISNLPLDNKHTMDYITPSQLVNASDTIPAQLNKVNKSGTTYVAYLFAHNPAPDGIIQSGSFTTDASGNADVPFDREPQCLFIKRVSSVGA